MRRNRSKLFAVALIAAIGLGVPALAKAIHSAKTTVVAGQNMQGVKAQRAPALDLYGSLLRAPTFGAPNPNYPALAADGSTGYNANLYVY